LPCRVCGIGGAHTRKTRRDGSNMDDRANETDDADSARVHGTTRIGPEAMAKDAADILGTIYEGPSLATIVESIRSLGQFMRAQYSCRFCNLCETRLIVTVKKTFLSPARFR
jgi:hypothetical protein